MKPRKWVIVLFCCILAVTFGLFEGLRSIEKNRHLEHLLMKQLSLASGGNVSVGKVRLGFLSVYLQNVDAVLSLQSCSVKIRDIKIAFSFSKLLKTRGGFAKSISKIILISPEVIFKLQNGKDNSVKKSPRIQTTSIIPAFKALPVEFLLVKKGSIGLLEGNDTALPIVSGDELSGKLWQDTNGLSMELAGKLCSRKKNLFIAAIFAKKNRDNHVSLRINDAQIFKPIRLQKATITAGILDGAFEFSFPDSVTKDNIEAIGWARVSNGGFTIQGLKQPVVSVGMYARLDNTLMEIDSLKCMWNGIGVRTFGEWDIASSAKSNMGLVIRSQGIRPQLLSFLPKTMIQAISGMGWFELKIAQEKNPREKKVSLSAGGLGYLGQSITQFVGEGKLTKGFFAFDTMAVRGSGFSSTGSGMVSFEKVPLVYSATYDCLLDSTLFLPDLGGKFSLRGTIHGSGDRFTNVAFLQGNAVVWRGISLGSPKIGISMAKSKPITFSTTPDYKPYGVLSGSVDSVVAGVPFLHCKVELGKILSTTILNKMDTTLASRIDSAWASALFTGTPKSFAVHSIVGVIIPSQDSVLPGIRGAFDVSIDKKEKNDTLFWQVAHRTFLIGDSVVSIHGQGTFAHNEITLDSASFLPGVKITGSIGVAKGNRIDLNVRYRDVSIKYVNTVFMNHTLPLLGGELSGTTHISGINGRLRSESDVRVRELSVGAVSGLATDLIMSTKDSTFTVLPAVIRQNGKVLAVLDTISNVKGMHFSGIFQDVDMCALTHDMLPEEFEIENHSLTGTLSGSFTSSKVIGKNALSADVRVWSKKLSFDSWELDSINLALAVDKKGIQVTSFTASDSTRSRITAHGNVPWSYLTQNQLPTDTLLASFGITGDLIATTERNISKPFHIPVAGRGMGTIDVAIAGCGGAIQIKKAILQVPRGVLRVRPYVAEDIKDFTMKMAFDNKEIAIGLDDTNENEASDKAEISFDMNGTISKRPIRIHNTHVIPKGFEPIVFGFLDFGAILVSTPHHGVDIHVPGFTDIGVLSDAEFAPKSPWSEFALSGPADRICISGTWILRTSELTYPLFHNVETHPILDPFPYITWNFDLKPGNRKLKYFYDTGKDRNLMRLIECYLDPISVISLRGRELDKTFKILGSLRSSKGAAFYGRVFDRNVDIGLDFDPRLLSGKKRGYDNTPVIWGSAEAVSDTSRFDRIKLTLITKDSITGAWSEKGRFHDIHFRVGATIENFPGAAERNFVTQEKDRYVSVSGAGSFVTSGIEQYLHRLLLQNMERRLARSLGLDVISIETSIASNYFNKFYSRQSDFYHWDYFALANVGVTLGRYILSDNVFVKWSTELIPVDTSLTPQYNVGFEIQPLKYLLMDVNYGVHMGEKEWRQNPQVLLQLRLPINDIRSYFDF